MTSPSKLIPLEEAERIVREQLPIGHALVLIEELRALAVSAGGAGTPITYGGVPIHRDDAVPYQRGIVAIMRPTPGCGAETPGAIADLIRTTRHEEGCSAGIDPDAYRCKCRLAERMIDASAELSSLQAKAAERDSAVGKARLADEFAQVLFDLEEDGDLQTMLDRERGEHFVGMESNDARNWLARYRALSATADTTEEEKYEGD